MPRPRRQRVAIPRRLTVRGKPWKVVVSSGLKRREQAVGLCEYDDHTIRIEANQTRREIEITWIHELLHALFPAGIVSAHAEERIVDRLDSRIHRALTDGTLAVAPPPAVRK